SANRDHRATASKREQSAAASLQTTARANCGTSRRRLEAKIPEHGYVSPQRAGTVERAAARWPRARPAKATSHRRRCRATVGYAHPTLSGSAQPRQIQSADSFGTGADHSVSYLFGSRREKSARLSLFRAWSRGPLVRHLGGVARDHSRARRLCPRTNGQPRAVTICRLKTLRAGADCFLPMPAAVWIAEVHALCRIDESARMGPAAV